jgi:hypothetical protein
MEAKQWRKLNELKHDLPGSHFARISKYQARSTYTRQLRSTKIDGLSSATAEGYFVMLKLSLAYSSIELINPSVINNLKIVSQSTAQMILAGKFDLLIDAMVKSPKVRDYKSAIDDEWRASLQLDSDLLPFIRQARHLMFHGAFSPSEAGLTILAKQSQLLTLAEEALTQTDEALITRVTKLYAQRLRG